MIFRFHDVVATYIISSSHRISSVLMSTIEDVLISKTSSTDTSGIVDISFLFRTLDIFDENETP